MDSETDKPDLVSYNRCNSMKVSVENLTVEKWYEDLQDDYRKFFNIFYPLMGIGYGVMTDDVIEYVEPKEMPDDEIGKWLKCFLEKGTNNSSSYSFFYDKFENKLAKKTEYIVKFINNIPTATDEDLLKDSRLTPQEWRDISQQIQIQGLDAVWETILSKILVNPKRQLGQMMRNQIAERCHRPDNKNYCTILTKMLGESLRSQNEKYKFHVKETQELEATVVKYRSPKAELLLKFCQQIQSECGCNKWVLTKLFKDQATTKEQPNLFFAIEKRDSDEFKELQDIDLNKDYKYVKGMLALAKRKKYPTQPNKNNDPSIPIGLTSYGNFNITTDTSSKVWFDLPFLETSLETNGSHYFYGLQAVRGEGKEIDPKTNKEKTFQEDYFDITFRHKVKTPKKHEVGDEIKGNLKSISLQRRKGDMYVKLAYTINHPKANERLAYFFRTADASQYDLSKLPDTITVGGIDLNIVNPLCGVKAKITKGDFSGPIQSFQFGSGRIISPPRVIISSSKDEQNLVDLRNKCKKIKAAIKMYKANKFKDIPMSADMMEFLENTAMSDNCKAYCKIHEGKPQKTALLIGLAMKYVKTKYRALKYKMRAQGHKNVADSIRLIEVMDQMASLTSSYERIHLKPGESLPTKKKFDKKRANFKKYVVGTLAAAVAKEYKECNIVFVEDLESNFDEDNNNNSLTRLFSPKMLIGGITQALENIGVQVVLTDKRGTSQTDPVTGKLGYRDISQKEKLFVDRDGKLGYIHADCAASLNVLLCGINHNVRPYKFYVAKEKDDETEQENNGKRMKKFTNVKYRTNKLKLKVENHQIIHDENLKAKAKDRLYGYFYFREDRILTTQEHFEQRNALKDRQQNALRIEEFDLNPDQTGTYNNYRL